MGEPRVREGADRGWARPAHESDERLVAWLASYMRKAASPAAAMALERMNRGSTRRTPSPRVPTLVIAREGDLDFRIEQVRETASRIPAHGWSSSREVHFPWGATPDAVVDEVERFVVALGEVEAEFDRALATVLFTDVVGSTEKAAELGDRRLEGAGRGAPTTRPGSARPVPRRRGRHGGGRVLRHVRRSARAVRCATSIVEAVAPLGIDVRAGVHTGEVETIDGKVGASRSVIGARVGASAGPSEVLVSQTVKDLVAGSGLVFEDAGEHDLKGLPDPGTSSGSLARRPPCHTALPCRTMTAREERRWSYLHRQQETPEVMGC